MSAVLDTNGVTSESGISAFEGVRRPVQAITSADRLLKIQRFTFVVGWKAVFCEMVLWRDRASIRMANANLITSSSRLKL
jgi:hypothetical protein